MGDLSKNFSRWEFRCKCGCGQGNVSLTLVAALQQLRDLAKRPVKIISGCRCPAHNRKEGGAAQSFHIATEVISGRAADIRIPGLSLKEMYRLAQEVPAFYHGGIGLYPDWTQLHVDVRGREARWAMIGGEYVDIDQALA